MKTIDIKLFNSIQNYNVSCISNELQTSAIMNPLLEIIVSQPNLVNYKY